MQVAGNLPYYITSPIIERVLSLGPNLLHAVFLIQKEVAERIVASPGSRDYGYLSVQVQVYAEPKYLFTVPPSAFRATAASRFGRHRAQTAAYPGHRRSCTDWSSSPVFASDRSERCSGIISPARSQSEAIDAQPEARLRAEQLSVAQFADLRDRILKFQ